MTCGKRLLIAVDQFVNAVTGGWPHETLSSRAYRWERDSVRSWPRKLIDGVLFRTPEHCRESYGSEKTGRHFPPDSGGRMEGEGVTAEA